MLMCFYKYICSVKIHSSGFENASVSQGLHEPQEHVSFCSDERKSQTTVLVLFFNVDWQCLLDAAEKYLGCIKSSNVYESLYTTF